jgi:hypothetical protein
MWLFKITNRRQWAFKKENFEFNCIFFYLDNFII